MFFFECYSYHTVRNVRTHCSPTRRSCDLTDILLAQRFAGATGNGRRAVDIEWEGVDDLNPWRFALANALGEEIPEGLRAGAGPYYQRIWATAPMLGLPQRAQGADRAAGEGIMSSAAMVDLYSQIYARSEEHTSELQSLMRS